MNKKQRERLAHLEIQNQQLRKAMLILGEWMILRDPLVRKLEDALGVKLFLEVEGKLRTHERKAD